MIMLKFRLSGYNDGVKCSMLIILGKAQEKMLKGLEQDAGRME